MIKCFGILVDFLLFLYYDKLSLSLPLCYSIFAITFLVHLHNHVQLRVGVFANLVKIIAEVVKQNIL